MYISSSRVGSDGERATTAVRGLEVGCGQGCVEVRSESPAAGIYLQRIPRSIASGGGGGCGGISRFDIKIA